MIPLDAMGAAMAEARNRVLETCLVHERQTHGGATCWPNRLSVVAYFAHCLGISTEAWEFQGAKGEFLDLLKGYEIHCQGGDCRHF